MKSNSSSIGPSTSTAALLTRHAHPSTFMLKAASKRFDEPVGALSAEAGRGQQPPLIDGDVIVSAIAAAVWETCSDGRDVVAATMTDVARLAGVSVSTVSYAISGLRPISKSTRARVLAAMEELGYSPNALARGLASKRSRIVALLYPTGERGLNPTELEFITGAADRAGESNYHLLLWTTRDRSTVAEVRRLTSQGLVDGALVMEVQLADDRIVALQNSGLPFAMIGRTLDSSGIDFADTDFRQTTRLALEHLRGLGHRRLLFLSQAQTALNEGYGPVIRSLEGIAEAAEALKMDLTVRSCGHSHSAGRALFADPGVDGVTAVVALNEQAIVGFIGAALASGTRIPQDLSVLSIVSSARTAEMTLPPLSTVSPPAREVGRRGIEVLIRRLEGDTSAAGQELVPSRFVDRGSTGPASSRRRPLGPGDRERRRRSPAPEGVKEEGRHD